MSNFQLVNAPKMLPSHLSDQVLNQHQILLDRSIRQYQIMHDINGYTRNIHVTKVDNHRLPFHQPQFAITVCH